MKKLEVRLQHSISEFTKVGTLAEKDRRVFFEYTSEFLEENVWLSPFKLPLRTGAFEHKDLDFSQIFGLFDDSLPDGWGMLLMDRAFRGRGLGIAQLSPLDRLAYLGERTMGALTYFPCSEVGDASNQLLDLSQIAKEISNVWEGSVEDVLPALLRAGGSPGGARPKIIAGVKENQIITSDVLPEGYESWIIKFTSPQERSDSGLTEYSYSEMARDAGLEIPETRIFESSEGGLYFGVKRFDRQLNKRFHIHTFGNLIHSNFRVPNSDYEDLLKVGKVLTKNYEEQLKLFRHAVFNAASHNRDDHVKKFSFILDPKEGWKVSPSYDLTFCEGPGGEHSMTICGEGRSPGKKNFIKLAVDSGIPEKQALEVIEEVCQAVSQWSGIASANSLAVSEVKRIDKFIQLNLKRLTTDN